MSDKLELKNITHFTSTPTGLSILLLNNINISFELSAGKIYSIAAPFRSGKSTLLKIISGIEKPDSGEVLLNEKKPATFFPYIPEGPSNFHWLSVQENITSVPNLKRKPEEVISAVGLKGYEDYIPNEKSVGFRFRISLARALSVSPLLVLMDDSLKNVDEETREELVDLIKRAAFEFNVTVIYATSSITSALLLSDEILLMKKNPGEIYNKYRSSGDRITDIKNIEELLEKEHLMNPMNFSI